MQASDVVPVTAGTEDPLLQTQNKVGIAIIKVNIGIASESASRFIFYFKQESFQHQDTDVQIKLKPNSLTSQLPRDSLIISEQNGDANIGALSTLKVANLLLVSMFILLMRNVSLIVAIMLIGKCSNCSGVKKACWCFWGYAG